MGDNSLYGLTYPEMRILRSGYEVMQQRKEDERKGVKPHHKKKANDFEKRLESGKFDEQIKEAKQQGVDPATL